MRRPGRAAGRVLAHKGGGDGRGDHGRVALTSSGRASSAPWTKSAPSAKPTATGKNAYCGGAGQRGEEGEGSWLDGTRLA